MAVATLRRRFFERKLLMIQKYSFGIQRSIRSIGFGLFQNFHKSPVSLAVFQNVLGYFKNMWLFWKILKGVSMFYNIVLQFFKAKMVWDYIF